MMSECLAGSVPWKVPIVLPDESAPPEVRAAFMIPVPGSVCVAVPGRAGGVDVYFEGGIYSREQDMPPSEAAATQYAVIAASRAIKRYPTVARFHLESWQGLTAIGIVDTEFDRYEVTWLGDARHLSINVQVKE